MHGRPIFFVLPGTITLIYDMMIWYCLFCLIVVFLFIIYLHVHSLSSSSAAMLSINLYHILYLDHQLILCQKGKGQDYRVTKCITLRRDSRACGTVSLQLCRCATRRSLMAVSSCYWRRSSCQRHHHHHRQSIWFVVRLLHYIWTQVHSISQTVKR